MRFESVKLMILYLLNIGIDVNGFVVVRFLSLFLFFVRFIIFK